MFKEAADLTDMAIQDMADNVNKMGTNMEAVQNAYSGFSRGNFTMLDNLKLGYSGTKEGMEDLLKKAEEIEAQQGRTTKFSIDSFADIIKAIHIVQDEMGITGTTSKEASSTIQGSISAFKSAWQNLITGFGDPKADLGKLISDVVSTGETALKNLIPTFKNVLKGLSTVLKDISPMIAKELPGIVNDVLPDVIAAVGTLAVAIAQNLPQIITVILDALPGILAQIGQALKDGWPQIQQAIMDALDTTSGKVLAVVMGVIAGIKALGIVNMVSNAVGAISGLLGLLTNPITLVVGAVVAGAVLIVQNWDNIKAAWGQAVEFFKTIYDGIKNVFTDVTTWIGERFKNAWSAVQTAWSRTGQFFGKVRENIKNALSNIGTWIGDKFRNAKESVTRTWDNIGTKFGNYRDAIMNAFKNVGTFLADRFLNARNAITNGWEKIGDWFGSVRESIYKIFTSMPDNFVTIGKNLLTGLGNGIVEGAKAVVEKAKQVAGDVLEAVKSFFGVASPSKVFMEIGGYLMEGEALGIAKKAYMVDDAMKAMSESVMNNIPEPDFDYDMEFDSMRRNRNREMISDYRGQYVEVPQRERPQNLTVVLELDRMELARAIYRLNGQETQRVGAKLAGGFA
jgi:phage-related protein